MDRQFKLAIIFGDPVIIFDNDFVVARYAFKISFLSQAVSNYLAYIVEQDHTVQPQDGLSYGDRYNVVHDLPHYKFSA